MEPGSSEQGSKEIKAVGNALKSKKTWHETKICQSVILPQNITCQKSETRHTHQKHNLIILTAMSWTVK